jgi:deoxyhypusine synthase|uniref:Deoxyhypusine synthase n=1 Tax=candidate division WOR-3 bacterium TaxID=2052148 RepID=A0A7C3UZB2_UNCW3
MKKEDFLKYPVVPFEIKEDRKISEILEALGKCSFQARNLSLALRVWEKMLREDTFIFLGLAGAMVPAGMRKIIAYLIKERYIDCLVSTGANLFHDIHETIGRYHYLGSEEVSDIHLRAARVDRIYDTFASEEEFIATDNLIAQWAERFPKKVWTTREFLYRIGKKLLKYENDGILKSAAAEEVPIYCPAIGDSSIGIALAELYKKKGIKIEFDLIRDVTETAYLASLKKTGVIYIGGGTPKNFIQQTEVTAPYIGYKVSGHKYALQITEDKPFWGGLSGCTFKEAQSWGKIALDADMVMLYCDATIALPLIVSALAEKKIKRKKIIRFSLGEEITVLQE